MLDDFKSVLEEYLTNTVIEEIKLKEGDMDWHIQILVVMPGYPDKIYIRCERIEKALFKAVKEFFEPKINGPIAIGSLVHTYGNKKGKITFYANAFYEPSSESDPYLYH